MAAPKNGPKPQQGPAVAVVTQAPAAAPQAQAATPQPAPQAAPTVAPQQAPTPEAKPKVSPKAMANLTKSIAWAKGLTLEDAAIVAGFAVSYGLPAWYFEWGTLPAVAWGYAITQTVNFGLDMYKLLASNVKKPGVKFYIPYALTAISSAPVKATIWISRSWVERKVGKEFVAGQGVFNEETTFGEGTNEEMDASKLLEELTDLPLDKKLKAAIDPDVFFDTVSGTEERLQQNLDPGMVNVLVGFNESARDALQEVYDLFLQYDPNNKDAKLVADIETKLLALIKKIDPRSITRLKRDVKPTALATKLERLKQVEKGVAIGLLVINWLLVAALSYGVPKLQGKAPEVDTPDKPTPAQQKNLKQKREDRLRRGDGVPSKPGQKPGDAFGDGPMKVIEVAPEQPVAPQNKKLEGETPDKDGSKKFEPKVKEGEPKTEEGPKEPTVESELDALFGN